MYINIYINTYVFKLFRDGKLVSKAKEHSVNRGYTILLYFHDKRQKHLFHVILAETEFA